MAEATKLRVTELDFDQVKNNFKNAQQHFWVFEGKWPVKNWHSHETRPGV